MGPSPSFSSRCFCMPVRGGHRRCLASAVNSQFMSQSDPPVSVSSQQGQSKRSKHHYPNALLASCVSSKLEEGDFKGAIRVACFDDKLANTDDSTFAALQSRHPLPPYDSDFSSIERNALPAINGSETDIVKAVFSFTAGGPMVFAPNISKA